MARRGDGIRGLLQEAKASGNGEAFKVLARGKCYRASAGARLNSDASATFFLEVLVHLCPPTSKIRIPELEMKLQYMKALGARGYSLHGEDDGCVSCEAVRAPHELMSELAVVRSLACKILTSETVTLA